MDPKSIPNSSCSTRGSLWAYRGRLGWILTSFWMPFGGFSGSFCIVFRAVQLFSICFRVPQWIQKPSSIASILIHSNRWCLLSPRTYSEHASPCAPKQRPKFPDSVLRLASAQSPQRTNDCFSLRVAWKMMRNPNQTLSVPKPRSVEFRFGFVVLSGSSFRTH